MIKAKEESRQASSMSCGSSARVSSRKSSVVISCELIRPCRGWQRRLETCSSFVRIADRRIPEPVLGFIDGRRHGIPLAVVVSAANVHDSKMMLATVDAIGPTRAQTRGRPRRRPHKLHADKGYDYHHLRLALRKRRIIPPARCGVEPKNCLGRYRWVVERTLSCLNRFRRLKIR
jgi:hypothetical protein